MPSEIALWWLIHTVNRYDTQIGVRDIQRVWGLPYSTAARVGAEAEKMGAVKGIRSSVKIYAPPRPSSPGVFERLEYLWINVFEPAGAITGRHTTDGLKPHERRDYIPGTGPKTIPELWVLMQLYYRGAGYITVEDVRWFGRLSLRQSRARVMRMYNSGIVDLCTDPYNNSRLVVVPIESLRPEIRSLCDRIRSKFELEGEDET